MCTIIYLSCFVVHFCYYYVISLVCLGTNVLHSHDQHNFVFWYTRRTPGVRTQTSYEDNIKKIVDFSTVSKLISGHFVYLLIWLPYHCILLSPCIGWRFLGLLLPLGSSINIAKPNWFASFQGGYSSIMGGKVWCSC